MEPPGKDWRLLVVDSRNQSCGSASLRQDGDAVGLPRPSGAPGGGHPVSVQLLHQVVVGRHDLDQVRRDHVDAQHARERRVQVNQIAQHILPGTDSELIPS